MSKLDLAYALIGKNRDQFFVPGKDAEIISFLGAGTLSCFTAIGPFVVAANVTNISLLIALGLFALAFLLRGIQQRRYRLTRARAVEELRGRLASNAGPKT